MHYSSFYRMWFFFYSYLLVKLLVRTRIFVVIDYPVPIRTNLPHGILRIVILFSSLHLPKTIHTRLMVNDFGSRFCFPFFRL